jgi:hypothetical protein
LAEHGQGGNLFYSPALHDLRAGLLGMHPARVFVFRGARLRMMTCSSLPDSPCGASNSVEGTLGSV